MSFQMTSMAFLRYSLRRLVLFLVGIILFASQTAAAQLKDPLSFPFYDPTSSAQCGSPSTAPVSSGPVSGSIYVIGDSLTVGMRDSGDLQGKLETAGFSSVTIDAIGGKTLSWGIEQVEASSETIASSSYVLLGLGTNNIHNILSSGSNVKSGGKDAAKNLMQQLYEKVRQYNSTAKVYWTSFFGQGDHSIGGVTYNYPTAYNILNEALQEVAAQNNISVIPWGTSKEAEQYISDDGLHYTNYGAMADFIVGGLTTNLQSATTTSAGCVCSVSNSGTPEQNEREIWAYFTSVKGLSPEATAGIMGSIADESGFDPHNVQNSANDKGIPDGPEIPIDAVDSDGRAFKGRYGYGLIQWTSAGRQENLVAFAGTSRSTGDLGLQLDFLWKELTESYEGTYTVLTTPGVSVREASDEVTLHFVTPGSVTEEHGTAASRAETLNNRGSRSQTFFDKYSGQSAGYSGGGGCNNTGVEIDLESADTTAMPCTNETRDLGPADGYRNGKLIKIRLCEVGSTRVNSQIAGSIKQMLTDSNAAGVELGLDGAGGSFRDMESQITVYERWCRDGGFTPTPPPYPKASWDDYQKCPGGAPPGYSNHQAGLGFDFVCNGVLIPQSYSDAQNNPCFQWLQINASKYGLFEFGKGEERDSAGYEGWHWSVDGN